MQANELTAPTGSSAPAASSPQPETEAYCAFLVCQLLTDQKQYDKVCLVFVSHMRIAPCAMAALGSLRLLSGRAYHMRRACAVRSAIRPSSLHTQLHPMQLKVVTTALVPYVRAFNRRTLDVFAARIYFYFSLAYEKAGALQSVRATLLELHCTAVLNYDDFGQEVRHTTCFLSREVVVEGRSIAPRVRGFLLLAGTCRPASPA